MNLNSICLLESFYENLASLYQNLDSQDKFTARHKNLIVKTGNIISCCKFESLSQKKIQLNKAKIEGKLKITMEWG